MSIIKVLPLPKFVANVNGFLDDSCGHLTPTLPMIHRDGWYYNRTSGECWYEHNGKAWMTGDVEQFLFTLKTKNHKVLRSVERAAIETLMANRICPRSLMDRYWMDGHIRQLSDTRRGVVGMLRRMA